MAQVQLLTPAHSPGALRRLFDCAASGRSVTVTVTVSYCLLLSVTVCAASGRFVTSVGTDSQVRASNRTARLQPWQPRPGSTQLTDIGPLTQRSGAHRLVTDSQVQGGMFAARPDGALLADMLRVLSAANVTREGGWGGAGWPARHKANDFRMQGFLYHYLYGRAGSTGGSRAPAGRVGGGELGGGGGGGGGALVRPVQVNTCLWLGPDGWCPVETCALRAINHKAQVCSGPRPRHRTTAQGR